MTREVLGQLVRPPPRLAGLDGREPPYVVNPEVLSAWHERIAALDGVSSAR